MSSQYVHQLSLDFPCTNNPRAFRIVDMSRYASALPVKCPLLQITPPGFRNPTNIDTILPEFNLVLNACTLGIQTAGCDSQTAILPDGIYNIRYSVSPNEEVFVEYYHLRTTQIVNKYNKVLCNLELAACEPAPDVKEALEELRLIKSFIDAAKVKVEDCHELAIGMELLVYANKRLMKLIGGDC